jgi:hypothetical protein
VKYGYFYGGGGGFGGAAPAPASNDYQPVTDTTGAIVKTADDVRDEDLATLFAGVPDQVRVTRLRADLAHASLAEDLILRASGDQEMLPAFRKAKLESGQPLCTVYNGCDPAGQAPRDEAQARSGAGAESFSCITAQSSRSDMPLGLAVAAGFLGLAVVRSRRQRS